MSFKIINGKAYPIIDRLNADSLIQAKRSSPTTNFKDVLSKTVLSNDSFVISNHAAERLQTRNISFDSADMTKINEGINKAEEKGSKECLILYRDVALVTSIKNRTIITAMDKESSKGNVFTNIDSVVML